MASTIEEIMTRDPRTVEIGDSLVDAAREMRNGDIGNVIVIDGGRVAGIVTDRDIVVRAIAEGRDPPSYDGRQRLQLGSANARSGRHSMDLDLKDGS